MKKRVADLEGAELNAWVAKALGWKHLGAVGIMLSVDELGQGPSAIDRKYPRQRWCLSGHNDWWDGLDGGWHCAPCYGVPHDYAGDWSIGGPIIDAHWLEIRCRLEAWKTVAWPRSISMIDGGFRLWAMRAFVASKFGEEVE